MLHNDICFFLVFEQTRSYVVLLNAQHGSFMVNSKSCAFGNGWTYLSSMIDYNGLYISYDAPNCCPYCLELGFADFNHSV